MPVKSTITILSLVLTLCLSSATFAQKNKKEKDAKSNNGLSGKVAELQLTVLALTDRLAELETSGTAGPAGPEGPQGIQGPQGEPADPALLLSLQTEVAALTSENAALLARLTTIEDLFSNVQRFGDNLLFTGINIQVVDGSGDTDGPVNGLGNIIVGYDEFATGDRGIVKTGSHNLIVGKGHNYETFGGVAAGLDNDLAGSYSTVLGRGNRTEGIASTVTGGQENKATGNISSVSGGFGGDAIGENSSISGGLFGIADGLYSSILGGEFGITQGEGSVIVGGRSPVSSGVYSVVVGGNSNSASGNATVVVGGNSNNARDTDTVVVGGFLNNARDITTVVVGGEQNNAEGSSTVVTGGSLNNSTGSTTIVP